MTWAETHQKSADLAFRAGQMRSGSWADAEGLYRQAAAYELEALDKIPLEKHQTRAVFGLSAASLLFKGGEFERAANLSLQLLNGPLPSNIEDQLRAVIQAVWTEEAKRKSDKKFLPGQVIVSLSGGEILVGGAPLDVIVSKVQNIQSLFIRTIEYLSELPFRSRGPAPAEVRDYCRPWLFQAAPGSYQFAVSVEAPRQSDMFKGHVEPQHVTDKFLDIVQAASDPNENALERVIDREDYREAFVKLTRTLSPTGRAYEKVRIYSYDNPKEVTLTGDSRSYTNEHVQAMLQTAAPSSEVVHVIGTLRALDLDKDWLEIDVKGRHQRVTGLEDAIDDIIGPLVNRSVRVICRQAGRRLKFLDIEEA